MRTWKLLAAAAVCLTMLGCGGDGGFATVAVDAKITIDGKPPAGSASIMVASKDESVTEVFAGYLNADGTAVFWTNGDQDNPDGLPVGEYTIELQPDVMNPGASPSALPFDMKVEAAGTLTLDLKPGAGGFPGMGSGIPGGL